MLQRTFTKSEAQAEDNLEEARMHHNRAVKMIGLQGFGQKSKLAIVRSKSSRIHAKSALHL